MTRRELERVYDRHADAVFRYALALAGDLSDARNILQELMIKLAKGSGGWDDIRDERAWLLSTTRNLALDLFRRSTTRRRYHEMSAAGGGALFMQTEDADVGALRQALEQAMQDLPEEQRTAVYLKLWEEMTYEEISRIFGVSASTTASRYRYGLKKLRNTLRPLYQEMT